MSRYAKWDPVAWIGTASDTPRMDHKIHAVIDSICRQFSCHFIHLIFPFSHIYLWHMIFLNFPSPNCWNCRCAFGMRRMCRSKLDLFSDSTAPLKVPIQLTTLFFVSFSEKRNATIVNRNHNWIMCISWTIFHHNIIHISINWNWNSKPSSASHNYVSGFTFRVTTICSSSASPCFVARCCQSNPRGVE